jgi:FMN-dependent NADH-azoreductase
MLVDELLGRYPTAQIIRRDLAEGIPLVDETWIKANNLPDSDRDELHRQALALSDMLIDELQADIWVLGTPVYNFSLPPVLKAWIDQICRARVTFAYSEQGPKGLLRDRRVYLAVASGGSKVGSPTEFLTPYVRHVLGFIGIKDIEIIAADQLLMAGDDKIAEAEAAVKASVAAL